MQDFGTIWGDFIDGLRRLGYRIGTDVVCASKFGVPQYRRRSILIACLREKLKPTALKARGIGIPTSDPRSVVVNVGTAIGHFPRIRAGEHFSGIPNHRARSLSETNVMRIAAAKPGESNAYLADTEFGDLSLACHRRAQEKLKTRCFTDVYTRMRPDYPSPTITTKCHSISNGRFGHYDTSQNRGISLREAATLQSFPDDYVFDPVDGVEMIARMIGNAVPPRLANYFATHAISLLDQRRFKRVAAVPI